MNERYDFLTAELRRLRADCEVHTYDIGVHLVEIADGSLYRAGGFDTLREYVAEAVELEERQAMKAMRLARNYSPEIAAQMGIERCDLYLTCIDLTPEEDRPADILRASIALDGVRIPVADATNDQMKEAIRILRGKPSVTPEAEAAAAALQGAGLDARARGDRVMMSVPATGLCAFFAAARAALKCS